MVSVIAIVPFAVVAYYCIKTYISLQRNIAAAKASGLNYVVIPVNLYGTVWLLINQLVFPLAKRLPKSWTANYIEFLAPDWVWRSLHGPFGRLGDTFLTVAPTKILIWTCTPEVVVQISQRRDNFPKPLETYAALNIYGGNMVTAEGAEWRKHRKISASSFTEKNNALVFYESISQTNAMLRKWTGGKNESSPTVTSAADDAMKVALHIISLVGFGVRLFWDYESPSDQTKKEDVAALKYGRKDIPDGHTMGFEQSLESLLANLPWILMLPIWLLKRLPIESSKLSLDAYINWGQYMQELFIKKKEEAKLNEHGVGMDIMGGMVRSSYGDVAPNIIEKGLKPLTDREIFGNAFVMILAGHETTANSIHFGTIMLAMNPTSQLNLQREIQTIVGDSPPESWDYDEKINALLGGMVGAVLCEALRLMPPVVNIPKSVHPLQDQTVTIEGKRHVLPRGAIINLSTAAAHRNPKYWPSQGPSKFTDCPNDLDDFIPERWIIKDGQKANPTEKEAIQEEMYGATGTDVAATLFRPTRGSFIPFSEGARSCLGRRLAQVEVAAVITTMFQKYSVELAVEDWASDEEVARMSKEEKKAVYAKATERSRQTLRAATTRLTLKLHDGHVPIRIMPKGQERFLHLYE